MYNNNYFDELPVEVVQYIMMKMDALTLTVINFVSKEFRRIVPREMIIISKKEICNEASKKGYLEILKWARENGCPWNEITCHMQQVMDIQRH